MQEEIKLTWHFTQSPQEVWEYLTRPELLEQWLVKKIDFQPTVGHQFSFISKSGKVTCEVLEVHPFTKLSYSWQFNTAGDNKPVNSKVVWTLFPKENGTELQLVHNGFTVLEDLTLHNNGWTLLGSRLMELLKNYTTTIEVAKPPKDVFNHIKDVPKWWSKDFEGSSTNLNDEFVICHPGSHYSKQKLIEVIPDKKVVWLVTDSKLHWLEKDKHEWTDTKMVFEITTKGDKTVLHFTHEGLVPEKECYAMCEQGWNMVIKERFFSYITDGTTI